MSPQAILWNRGMKELAHHHHYVVFKEKNIIRRSEFG
jgi:hypothetical protein